MTTLVFLAALAAIFVAIVAGESRGAADAGRHHPTGLMTWLVRGNWPAKVGGLLMLVGAGALLRYAALNIELPDIAKLSAGVVLSAVLGLLSMFVPDGPARRPVSLALGGAAFGVAYLTVYSAFALFGYLDNPTGLGLLGVTSLSAAAYAVRRSALSLAVLSQVGAFLAPAFAIGDPGPQVVYGYYVGAVALTLCMVMLRGWRPLIHLSFLFTLAGGVFFAWTSGYFTAEHADSMRVFLLILVMLHVAMPLLERRANRLSWLESLDLLYMMALPMVAVVLAYFIERGRLPFSAMVFMQAGIWATAAVALASLRREGALAHAVIAGLLAALATAIRFRGLPWELVLLALSVIALEIAAARRPDGRLLGILAGSVVSFGALHMLDAVATSVTGPAFVNGGFLERVVGAGLLITAGAICRRIRQSLDTLLLAMGILWAALAVGVELVRVDLATAALVAHGLCLLAAASLWVPGRKLLLADRNVAVVAIAIVVTAFWAAAGHPLGAMAWLLAVAASFALIGLAIRPVVLDDDSTGGRALAALAAPVAAGVWAMAGAEAMQLDRPYAGLVPAALIAIATLWVGRAMPGPRGEWLERVVGVFAAGFGFALAVGTLIHIARNPWAIALEFLCLAGIVIAARIRGQQGRSSDAATVACALGLALVLQANLLRAFGPAGDLDLTDVFDVRWPAVISLLWAGVGFLLTLWSRRVGSRAIWIAGAALLVVAAVKLLIYDFGSLGDLANILAVIAAGGLFLLVGWLAPMPPAGVERARCAAAGPARETPDGSKHATRTVAILVAIAVVAYDVRDDARKFFGESRFELAGRGHEARNDEPGADVPPVDEPRDVEARADEPRAEVPSGPHDYLPPPIRGADGVPAYTQYSLPQPATAREDRSAGRIPPKPAPGEAGIDQLRREGRIRPATRQDVDLWIAATGADRAELHLDTMDRGSGGRYVYRTYVVLRDLTYPEGLHGAHSVTFIVPRHVPRPYGDPGHSRVLETP